MARVLAWLAVAFVLTMAIGASPIAAVAPDPGPSLLPSDRLVETIVVHETIDGLEYVSFGVTVRAPDAVQGDGGGAQISCDDTAIGLDQSCTAGPTALFDTVECWVTVLVTNRGHFAADCHNEQGSVALACDYLLPAMYYLSTGLPCVWTTTGDVLAGASAQVDGAATSIPVGPWTATMITTSS